MMSISNGSTRASSSKPAAHPSAYRCRLGRRPHRVSWARKASDPAGSCPSQGAHPRRARDRLRAVAGGEGKGLRVAAGAGRFGLKAYSCAVRRHPRKVLPRTTRRWGAITTASARTVDMSTSLSDYPVLCGLQKSWSSRGLHITFCPNFAEKSRIKMRWRVRPGVIETPVLVAWAERGEAGRDGEARGEGEAETRTEK